MPAILQRASTGLVSKNDTPRPALDHKPTNRLSSFLGKIRPGHHKDRSSDDSQTSSASSTLTNNNDPPRSTPVKRATFPPVPPKDPPSPIARRPVPPPTASKPAPPPKPLPPPKQNLADSGVIYPQQTSPPRKEISPQPQKSAMRRNGSNGEAAHDSGMSGIERVLSNDSVQTTKTTESRAGSTARIRFAQNHDEADADGAYRPRPRRNSSTGTRGRRSSIYYREHEGGDY